MPVKKAAAVHSHYANVRLRWYNQAAGKKNLSHTDRRRKKANILRFS
jgi:hypothetical protein